MCLSNCSDKNNQQALGTLERDRVVLKATAAEIILAEPIREGSFVKKSDLLVQLDDTQAQANLKKAEAKLANAKAIQIKLRRGARAEDIEATRAQLEGAQAQVIQAIANFNRVATLSKEKMIGQAEVDNARSLRDSAQADVRRANQNLLALTNGTRPEDLQAADAQVAEAEANIAIENHTLKQLSITATRDGFLDRLPKHIGERTAINDPLAILLVGSSPYARVYIPEPARTTLSIGQTLNVHVDGYEKSFAGKLRWISQDPAFTPYYGLNARDRALLMYLAEIDLPETAKDLPSGLPVQVDIHPNLRSEPL
ncbi:MAG: HlyD family efflux transporter periplasmic adaptor subunit [Gammaproteobacteria bacterium]|nr:MAG: HlyD family efflux transporter periplasmic adaptor subunit [Gammaproteobacteria bacterium]